MNGHLWNSWVTTVIRPAERLVSTYSATGRPFQRGHRGRAVRSPAIMAARVDLPEPFSPTKATVCPAWMVSVTSSTAGGVPVGVGQADAARSSCAAVPADARRRWVGQVVGGAVHEAGVVAEVLALRCKGGRPDRSRWPTTAARPGRRSRPVAAADSGIWSVEEQETEQHVDGGGGDPADHRSRRSWWW